MKQLNSLVVGFTFQVTMYGQSFLVSTQSTQRVLGMLHLAKRLPSFSLEVQALTHGELNTILAISLLTLPSQHGFSLLSSPIYTFYHSSHRAQIYGLATLFIHVILFGQQFDIGQVILNVMTPYCDPLHCYGALPFALLISRILEEVDFEFDSSLGVQVSHTHLDVSSQLSNIVTFMAPWYLQLRTLLRRHSQRMMKLGPWSKMI